MTRRKQHKSTNKLLEGYMNMGFQGVYKGFVGVAQAMNHQKYNTDEFYSALYQNNESLKNDYYTPREIDFIRRFITAVEIQTPKKYRKMLPDWFNDKRFYSKQDDFVVNPIMLDTKRKRLLLEEATAEERERKTYWHHRSLIPM